jgi:hypothetical protein
MLATTSTVDALFEWDEWQLLAMIAGPVISEPGERWRSC